MEAIPFFPSLPYASSPPLALSHWLPGFQAVFLKHSTDHGSLLKAILQTELHFNLSQDPPYSILCFPLHPPLSLPSL